MSEYFFLDQDNDCHWYLIPHMQRAAWFNWLASGVEEVPVWARELGGGTTELIFLAPRFLDRETDV